MGKMVNAKTHSIHPSLIIRCGKNSNHNRTLRVGPLNKRTPAPTRLYLDAIRQIQTTLQTPPNINIHKPPDALTSQYTLRPHLHLTGFYQAPCSPDGCVSLRTLDSDAPTRLRTAHNLRDLWPEPPLPKKKKQKTKNQSCWSERTRALRLWKILTVTIFFFFSWRKNAETRRWGLFLLSDCSSLSPPHAPPPSPLSVYTIDNINDVIHRLAEMPGLS